MNERVHDIFGTVREIPASMMFPMSCWPPPSKEYALQCAERCWNLRRFKGADAQSWIWLFRWAGFRDL
jgi:hypothetical protein